MSHQTFFTDNMVLALTLAGTAGLLTDRIVSRDMAFVDNPDGQHDDDGQALPALVLWPGDGRPDRGYFPVAGDTTQPGLYAVIWHAFLPYDTQDGWQTRWDALQAAIRATLLAPGALVTAVRPGPAQVRWGEEPPLFLKNTTSPEGMELFYTVAMEVC